MIFTSLEYSDRYTNDNMGIHTTEVSQIQIDSKQAPTSSSLVRKEWEDQLSYLTQEKDYSEYLLK